MKKASALKSCIKASISKSKYIFIIYWAYSLLCIIIGVLLSLSQVHEKFFSLNMFLANLFEIAKNVNILAIALALVSVIWLFGKYTNSVSNNLIKSLPAKDKHLFCADFLIGLIIFIIPILFSIGAQTLLAAIIENSLDGVEVFETVGVSFDFIFNYIFSYCVAVFCISISSGILETSIIFAIFNFIPSIVASFVAFAKSCILGLFPIDEFANKLELKTLYDITLKSVSKVEKDSTKYIDILKVSIILILISFILVAVSYFLFVKLRAGDNKSSKLKKHISKISLSAISFYGGFMILFFKRTTINLFNALIIIPTMIIASFVIFYISNTITYKSLHISLKKFIPYLPVLALMLFIGTLYFTGGYGAATYIPKAENVKAVSFNYTNNSYVEYVQQALRSRFIDGKALGLHDYEVQFPVVYDDENSINTIITYHDRLLKEYKKHGLVETQIQNSTYFPGEQPVVEITYKLKSGRKVKRYYNYKGDLESFNDIYDLPLFEKSVTKKESRALDYINRQPVENIIHKLYISAAFSNDDFVKFEISDKQLKDLVNALYQDEKNLSSEEILSSTGGDVYYIDIQPNNEDYLNLTKEKYNQFNINTITPSHSNRYGWGEAEAETTEGEPYFKGVFNGDGESTQFVVKPFYNNTIKVLNEIVATSEEHLPTENKETIKQIVIGRWEPGSFSYLSYTRRRANRTMFKHGIENITYQYYYHNTEKFYNESILTNEDLQLVDGEYFNKKAIDYLVSNLKMHSSIDNNNPGYVVMFNTQIDQPFMNEPIVPQGRRLFYITAEQYDKFISLCKE